MLLTTLPIRDGIGAEVDVGREELADQRAEGISLRQARDLVAELEVLQDVLHIGREAIEIGLEVGPELLLAGAGLEIAQGEFGRVVEGLARCLPEGRVLMDDLGRVEGRLHLQHRLLGGLQHGIQPAQHCHRQDHIAVLTAHVEIPKHVVGDAPDEVGDPVELALFHGRPLEPVGCRAGLRMPQVWAGWVVRDPHAAGFETQGHRWAAPTRGGELSNTSVGGVLGTATPGLFNLVPSLRLLELSGPFGGATPGPCHLWLLQLEHLAA